MKKRVNLKVKLNAKLSKVRAKRMREQKILTYRGRGNKYLSRGGADGMVSGLIYRAMDISFSPISLVIDIGLKDQLCIFYLRIVNDMVTGSKGI